MLEGVEMIKRDIICILVVLLNSVVCRSILAKAPEGNEYVSSIGMKFVRIEASTFRMGQLKTPLPWEILPVFRGRGLFDLLREGDFDEKPVHTVTITRPFYIAVFEVTNFQYELFDPQHKKLRGKDNGLSKDDDEAVINVNWYDAQAFCQWLSDKEGLPYRLPTETEWEYACRAGTTSNYYAGDILPEQFRKTGGQVSLHVGKTPPNAWGLYDMHGNVEEWCHDWYGPYEAELQLDPVGYISGDVKVLRGGSHSTGPYYLRSANRMGQLPECRNRFMGFRVVLAELPDAKPLPKPIFPNQQNVIQRDSVEVARGPDPEEPYFRGPHKYVNIPTDSMGPVFAGHNHDPAIVECPNGDLLACWYTCVDEGARELAQAASRLRWGEVEWQQASPFWDAPDRNDHAPAMWFDGQMNIYHFTGVGDAGGRGRMIVAMRTSDDSGATWSAPRVILPEFTGGHQLSEPVFRMQDGSIVLVVDGRRTLWISRDEGLTWSNPGGDILGIHSGVTQLKDGSIFALSRSNGDREKMPISISSDGGKTFTYKPSEFTPIGGGQRLVLLRLKEAPLFFASFASIGEGIEITDSTGSKRKIRGLFAAISEDEGKTWPYKRLVSDDGPGRTIECTDGGAITLSARSAEYRGYLAGCQSADGLIHLISSRNHYAFNLKWLKTPPPPQPAPPVRVKRAVETFKGPDDFDNEGWFEYKGFTGGFNSKGQYTVNSPVHYNGLNRVVGSGSFEALFAVKNIHYNPPGQNVSEGVTLGFKDAFNRHNPTMFIWIKENVIVGNVFEGVTLSSPPTSAKARFVWNEKTRQWKVFYGLNGAEPLTEFPESKPGLYYESPLTESTAAFFLMSNGSMDIDHFEIKPVEQ